MFIQKNKVYAESGSVLRNKQTGEVCFQGSGVLEDYEEIVINLSDIEIHGCICLISNGLIAHWIGSKDFEDLKSEWVKKRYSYDDQIAIMLNRSESESDLLYFNKMQEWRIFASNIARAIQAKI